ncbi:MAG: 50S ribosomal protein L27 [Patescibacteria group bacterium]|jgi:large subunit ribosomal protein L27|nr:50S ribosomal protein L27 [Patescibacteria group bacterium]
MAHTKSGGSTRLGRDSEAKRLGVKLFDGQKAKKGAIIVRQRGETIKAGKNVAVGKDYTLYALKDGVVKFSEKQKSNFDGSKKRIKIVSVI